MANPVQQYTNKIWEMAVAKNFPNKCGNKKCKNTGNLIKKRNS
jgi:hypothetical protein